MPIACLTNGKDPVIGAWTTASLPKNPAAKSDADSERDWQDPDGRWMTQVSRLANPLVNEIIIGLPDKDRFNGSNPLNDAQFLKYVTDPNFARPVEHPVLERGLGAWDAP